jgi:hypothetical protein
MNTEGISRLSGAAITAALVGWFLLHPDAMNRPSAEGVLSALIVCPVVGATFSLPHLAPCRVLSIGLAAAMGMSFVIGLSFALYEGDGTSEPYNGWPGFILGSYLASFRLLEA